MPWTPKAFRFLMSKFSPLTDTQKTNDQAEAHANPAMVHMKKKSVLQSAKEHHSGR
jgi:hypothetical protein